MSKFLKSYALAALLVLGLAAFAIPAAHAQDGKIGGTIIDFDGKPWADLPIKAKSDQGAVQETKTDTNGKFQFVNLSPGKYTVIVQVPQTKEPFTVVTEVHSGAETPPVNWNFKEILEKQNPEAAAQMKKQAEEKSKFSGMKVHFDQGMALLEQERAAKADLTKAPADQKDAAKAKVADLSNQAVAQFQEAQKSAPRKIPTFISSGPAWVKPTIWPGATTTPSTLTSRPWPRSQTMPATTTTSATSWLAPAKSMTQRPLTPRAPNWIPRTPRWPGAISESVSIRPAACRKPSNLFRRPRKSILRTPKVGISSAPAS